MTLLEFRKTHEIERFEIRVMNGREMAFHHVEPYNRVDLLTVVEYFEDVTGKKTVVLMNTNNYIKYLEAQESIEDINKDDIEKNTYYVWESRYTKYCLPTHYLKKGYTRITSSFYPIKKLHTRLYPEVKEEARLLGYKCID